MGFYRGQSGYAALGGQFQGSTFLSGALIADATEMDIDADGGTLIGSVAVGDTFTIAGEAGAPTHTVTGGPFYLAAANAILDVSFTPGIAAGGVADNAAVTFGANSIAQVRSWNLNTDLEELDTTVMGDDWKTVMGGVAVWRGSMLLLLDYGDTRQAALIDKIIAGSPTGTISALTLGVEKKAAPAGIKQFYGAAQLRNLQFQSQMGQIVQVSADFSGSGSLAPQSV